MTDIPDAVPEQAAGSSAVLNTSLSSGFSGQENSCGCLPANGPSSGAELDLNRMPVGMGYVPWQSWGQTYPFEQGLARGTIFPVLDLPFLMGRCR